MKTNCQCEKCKKCCWHSMGWFGSIEEIEGASKIMKMPVKQFAQEYLIREWWFGENDEVEVPAPRKNFKRENLKRQQEDKKIKELLFRDIYEEEYIKNSKGFKKASWGHNLITGFACIFLNDKELCKIHKSKPMECREVFACKPTKINYRIKAVKYWRKHQDYIKNLIK